MHMGNMRPLLLIILLQLVWSCNQVKEDSDEAPAEAQEQEVQTNLLVKPVGSLVEITEADAQELIYSNESALVDLKAGFTFRKTETCFGNSTLGPFDSKLVREFTVLDYYPEMREIKFYVKTKLNRTGGICAINTKKYMHDSEYILYVYIPSSHEAVGMLGDIQDFFTVEEKQNKFVIMKAVNDVPSVLYGHYVKHHEYGLNLNLPYPASVYVEQSMNAQAYGINATVKIFNTVLAPVDPKTLRLRNLDQYYEGDKINSDILDQILELTRH